jgi:ketosteroid isomerase-like protein
MTDVAERLLRAVTARDYDAIEECFAPEVRFDVLTPHQLREHRSATEATERYRAWLEPLERFEVLERDASVIADRVRIRYRFRGRDPKSGWQLNEHTGYAVVEGGRIASMTVTCAGFRPIPEP